MIVQDNIEREKEWSQGDQLQDYYSNVTRHEDDLDQDYGEANRNCENQLRKRSSVFSYQFERMQ